MIRRLHPDLYFNTTDYSTCYVNSFLTFHSKEMHTDEFPFSVSNSYQDGVIEAKNFVNSLLLLVNKKWLMNYYIG